MQVINITKKESEMSFAGKLGRLAGEIVILLEDTNPADFEEIRNEMLLTARKLAHKSRKPCQRANTDRASHKYTSPQGFRAIKILP